MGSRFNNNWKGRGRRYAQFEDRDLGGAAADLNGREEMRNTGQKGLANVLLEAKKPRAVTMLSDEQPKVEIISPTPRAAKLREELLSKTVPWDKITVSFDDFPYYVEEDTKSRLVECVAPILKYNKQRKFCARLDSSSRRTLLRSITGSELYRERLVRALAREMQVPLVKLDEDHGCDDLDYKYEYYDHLHSETYEQNANKLPKFKKGDRVCYTGRNYFFEKANNRTLSYGQGGEVCEVNDYTDTVGVAFNISGLKKRKANEDEENTEILQQALLVWLNVRDINLVGDIQARSHDCIIAMEVLCQVLKPQQPVIVYFADSFLWPPEPDYTVYLSLRCIFNQLPEGVAMICPENYPQEESKQDAAKMPNFAANFGKLRLFSNAICLKYPKNKDLKTVISEANLQTMHKVLKDHNLSCLNMEHLEIDNTILKRKKVEKIVGWAVSHYLTSCPLPCVNEEKLHIPYDSIKLAISRFMEEEDPQRDWIASKVVHLKDIGVKFDDVGVVENVKNVLYKTVILPMRRPELFSLGNTLRFCKGILLFGPPGTGKSLVAKALAAESGANFINITAADFTSLNLEALFSCASKLAPVIIYLDEVDSFPGACYPDINARNQSTNFMTAWDNWNSKESQRVLLIAATNRPFDLDEAVICHLPRRIFIGLPDVESRSKMLKIFLDKENLESGFSFDQLAEATEGYSMMDLKNLCLDAVYGPIDEFLEQESKGEASDGVPVLRPLKISDFIQSKSKVRPSSVAENESSLREWNEKYGEVEEKANN